MTGRNVPPGQHVEVKYPTIKITNLIKLQKIYAVVSN